MRLTRYRALFFGFALVLLTPLALSPSIQTQPLRITLGTATPAAGFSCSASTWSQCSMPTAR